MASCLEEGDVRLLMRARQGLSGDQRLDRAPDPRRAAEPAAAHRRRENRRAADESLTYARDGDDYLVVASKGGEPKAVPGWYHNLKAQPRRRDQRRPAQAGGHCAHVGPDDPDYARLWRIADDNNSGRYSAYQKRTSRPITVIELTPKA